MYTKILTEEYRNYFNRVISFKINNKIKNMMRDKLLEENKTFQDWMNERCREYLKENSLDLPTEPVKYIHQLEDKKEE